MSETASPLPELACHMGSHSVTCYPADATSRPCPNRSWYSVLNTATAEGCKAELLLWLCAVCDVTVADQTSRACSNCLSLAMRDVCRAYTTTRSTQPCIPPGSHNRVPPGFGCGKGGNVSSVGWQVTLCDPMWHVSSRSGVATLRTAIHLLLTLPCAAHLQITLSISTTSMSKYVFPQSAAACGWILVPTQYMVPSTS